MNTLWTALRIILLIALSATVAHAAKAKSDPSEFERALRLAAKDKTRPARRIVDGLLEKKSSSVSRDRLLMTKGRLLFQDGDMRGALKAYEQIPSDSDHWLESLEERAWAHLRLGEHGSALAELKTIKAPIFVNLVGPEPFFLTGLIHLKICDYPAIFESIKEFKEKYRPRLTAMQELANTGTSEAATKALTKLREQPLSWAVIAPEARSLPRLFHRDRAFVARAEALKAGRKNAMTRAQARLRDLARRDLKEISDVLQKMHLLEAEVIQRIHIAEKPNGRANRNVKVAKGEEVLVFSDTGEFWLDELDKYQVSVKGCPTQDIAGGKKP